MHFTPSTSSSLSASYQVNNQPLASIIKPKDLGVTVCANLSWSKHIKLITAKAYRSLHLIRRTFSSPSSSLRLHLYLLLVRSQLCYSSQLWRPRLLKDIICLEQIQRRATTFILSNNFLGYTSRLHSLHLLPLMHWLEFLDVMFLVKCLKNPRDNQDLCSFVTFVKSCTRASTTMKLQHNFCHLSTTRHFYFNRIVLLLNAMPPVDISQSFLTIRQQSSELFLGSLPHGF